MRKPPFIATGLIAAMLCAGQGMALAEDRAIDKISHVFVLFLENRSFDNLFGDYPGAEGIRQAIRKGQTLQRDTDGKVFKRLPLPIGDNPFDVPDNPKALREMPLPSLPNAPFAIDKLSPKITTAVNTRDMVHLFYTNRAQINGGRNDLFAALSNARGLSMGYYSRDVMQNSALWKLARRHVLLDHFFMGAFGGSFLNHQYLVCACAPQWPNVPARARSMIDGKGRPLPVDGQPGRLTDNSATVAADGDFAVNTTQSVNLNDGDTKRDLLPPLDQPTIGDRLTAKGVDFAWYTGGFDLASKAGRTKADLDVLRNGVRFQWHHNAFAYYRRFDPTTPEGRAERAAHLRDTSRLDADIISGALPPVTFYKPSGVFNQHPGYAALDAGDAEVARIAALLAASPMKESYALIITYDENGGFFDHVAPPSGPAAGARADFLGPGTRVPTLVISPLAPKGKIDSREYETSSILKLITERFHLDPLPSPRVQAVNSLGLVFEPAK